MALPGGTEAHLREEPPQVTERPPLLNISPPPVDVGGLTLESPLLLAPLAGITIPALRLFYSGLGAAAVHTEMISSTGLLRGNKKTGQMLTVLPGEAPAVVQFFAGDSDSLRRSAEEVLPGSPFRAIGINMACPMPKVLKKGSGSRLLERPDLAFEMVAAVADLGFPVWPKVRKCPPGYPLTTAEFCKGLLDAGASLVCLHGRTPGQRYAGVADREVVRETAALFPGRICASGDVYTAASAADYLAMGCSAVLLARGALADPFLFARALAFLGFDVHNDYVSPSPAFQVECLFSLGNLMDLHHGSALAVLFVKRLLAGMFKGLQGVGALRRDAAKVCDWNGLKKILEKSEEYFERREQYSGCTI